MKMKKKAPREKYEAFPKGDALHLRWEARYLPNNIIHRLLIRKYNELDRGCVWRTGGLFHEEHGSCDALVEQTDWTIDVYVAGDERPREYMDILRREILAIIEKLGIQNVKEYICYTKDGVTDKEEYRKVLRYYQENERVYFADIDQFVPAFKLLRDNYLPAVYSNAERMVIHNEYHAPGEQVIQKEEHKMTIKEMKAEHIINSEGNSNTFTQNNGGFSGMDFAALAKAVQVGSVDPKKLTALKKELLALSKSENVPMTVQLKMKPLIKALETVEDEGDDGKKLWDVLRPYIGDAASLSAIVTLFAEHGGKLVNILKTIFV